MPYVTNDELPPSVRNHLPVRAQDIYREAFNHAWTSYAHSVGREQIAHRTAWAAVKRQFHRGPDGQWTANAGGAADFVT
jgi:cation transport regulator